MLVDRDDSNFTVATETYTLTFPADRPFVYVEDAQGQRLAELFVLSSVHALHGHDDTVSVGAWEIEETAEQIVCSLLVQSLVWDRKVYRVRCSPQRFSYEVEIEGSGQLADVHYFGGYNSAYRRWGSGFFRSGHFFKRGFNPEPVAEETQFFAPTASARIDLLGVSLPGKRDWFFTPAPFCFAFEGHNGWIGMGVEAQPGANRWTEYSYHGGLGFHLSLAYEGYTQCVDRTRFPQLALTLGKIRSPSLACTCSSYRARGLLRPSPPDQSHAGGTSRSSVVGARSSLLPYAITVMRPTTRDKHCTKPGWRRWRSMTYRRARW